MNKKIRLLSLEDFPYLEAMETGIEDDYVKRIFERLVSGNNRLFGLFMNDQLTSLCGYSIFANRYAMLGRIRSDRRFRGNDLATQLTAHVLKEAFKLPEIQWVGANTQEENLPARRVLEKLGLTEHAIIHGATTKDVSMLASGASPWQKVHDLARKKEWVNEVYVKTGKVFPYECYYPFPASADLFSEDELMNWSFYENETATRVLIVKADWKRNHYLHTIYPWDDLMEQQGLWETVSAAYRKFAAEVEGEAYIWMDLTKEAAQSLPDHHSFTLPSPWILYGTSRKQKQASENAGVAADKPFS